MTKFFSAASEDLPSALTEQSRWSWRRLDSFRCRQAQSGAHTEIDKSAPPDAAEKNFVIRGPPECVDRAKQMVMEKIGLIQGSGYGSFPGQTFNGGGGGNGYGG